MRTRGDPIVSYWVLGDVLGKRPPAGDDVPLISSNLHPAVLPPLLSCLPDLAWVQSRGGSCWFFQPWMLPTKPGFEEVDPSTPLLALSLYLLLHQKNDRRPPQQAIPSSSLPLSSRWAPKRMENGQLLTLSSGPEDMKLSQIGSFGWVWPEYPSNRSREKGALPLSTRDESANGTHGNHEARDRSGDEEGSPQPAAFWSEAACSPK